MVSTSISAAGRGSSTAWVCLAQPPSQRANCARGRDGAVDRQALGRHCLVQPRVARPTGRFQDQDSRGTRSGNVVLQFRATAADELVGLLDDDQPPAAKHGHGGQFFEHVAEFGGSAFKRGEGEIGLVAPQDRLAEFSQ